MSDTDQTISPSKRAHYHIWVEAWLKTPASTLPAQDCLSYCVREGVAWLKGTLNDPEVVSQELLSIVACFKKAAEARLLILGGQLPPSCDEVDVLSERYDARIRCSCQGLFPIEDTLDLDQLKKCDCKAINRMISEAELVNSKESEWNSSDLFTSRGLTLAVTELALCHADTQPYPSLCHQTQHTTGSVASSRSNPSWLNVRAPDRKPHPTIDLLEDEYFALYPTAERIRLSADAKNFFAKASGCSLVDPGIQTAIADSGDDVLIGDYGDAASERRLMALQKNGAAAFSFLKLCEFAGLIGRWHFDQLVAQTIQFRIISYWRDHADSRIPDGIYGSRMTGLEIHRRIDLGMIVGVVSASIATGNTITVEEYMDLVEICALLNDLPDLRGDAWRKQRENVVLRGIRGCLCEYLDGLLSKCIQGSATLITRSKVSTYVIFSFCNWMLLGSGHKFYEQYHGTQPRPDLPACEYKSKHDGCYKNLLDALEPYGTLGEQGPRVSMTRKQLQLQYSERIKSSSEHIRWLADVARIMLRPDVLRRLVDIVHLEWQGDLGDVEYCK